MQSARETGKYIRNGSSCSYYGDCGPHTKSGDGYEKLWCCSGFFLHYRGKARLAFAKLELPCCQIALANSCCGGLDLPKALMKTSCDFFEGDTGPRWLCWHEESGAQIWKLEAEQDVLRLTLYSSGSSFALPASGEALAQKLRNGEPCLTAECDLYLFAQSVFHAFQDCRRGEKQAKWNSIEFSDSFPEAECKALRKHLRYPT